MLHSNRIYQLFILILILNINLNSKPVIVHDPAIIADTDNIYLFCTGYGISNYISKNLTDWTSLKPVFEEAPIWTYSIVPEFKNHIWAPDISYHNGQYYLYYSVSSFGRNGSAIGLAINQCLIPENSNYKWIDKGIVLESVPGRDLWNAIDPNLCFDENNEPWLTFGSFWTGIKLVKLNENCKDLSVPEKWYSIAKRIRDCSTNDTLPGEGAIEAPFIINRNGYFYLFASIDFCCRGNNSNYKIIVGKSGKITGPYIDKQGISLLDGGGTIIQQGDILYSATGHNCIFSKDNIDYIAYHAYSKELNGQPVLVIKKLVWDENGWPSVSQ